MSDTSLVHVRDRISSLKYDQLAADGHVPTFDTASDTSRYPLFVYKHKCFAFFGMFMDFLVRRMLRDVYPIVDGTAEGVTTTVERLVHGHAVDASTYVHALARYTDTTLKWKDVVYESFLLASLYYDFSEYTITKAEVMSSFSLYGAVNRDVVAMWAQLGLGTPGYNEELNVPPITGHPDIVTTITIGENTYGCILDIKTTAKFANMAADSWLQTLAYVALARAQGYSVDYVGIVLPMQRQIVVYDVSTWDSSVYMATLMSV